MADKRTANLVSGFKDLLVAGGLTNVVRGQFRSSTPDQAIGLNPYPLTDDMVTGVSLSAIQVVMRGTVDGGDSLVLNMQDDVLNILGNIRMITLYDIPVSVAWRQLSAPIALDERERPVIRDTYYIRSDRLGITG